MSFLDIHCLAATCGCRGCVPLTFVSLHSATLRNLSSLPAVSPSDGAVPLSDVAVPSSGVTVPPSGVTGAVAGVAVPSSSIAGLQLVAAALSTLDRTT